MPWGHIILMLKENQPFSLPYCCPPSHLNWRKGFSFVEKVNSEEFVLSAFCISIKIAQKEKYLQHYKYILIMQE